MIVVCFNNCCLLLVREFRPPEFLFLLEIFTALRTRHYPPPPHPKGAVVFENRAVASAAYGYSI